MTQALMLLALAALPAANPMSLPEGVAPAPIPAAPAAVYAALPAASQGAAPAASPATSIDALLAHPTLPPVTSNQPAGAPAFDTASSSHSSYGLAAAALLIVAFGALTLWMQKRKRGVTRHIQVIETASLGPKRSLALVVVGGQSMLLSCCDAGIFLVSSQPATPEMLQATAPAAQPADDQGPTLVFPAPTPRVTAPFMAHLAEAEETQGLRRRLSEAGALR